MIGTALNVVGILAGGLAGLFRHTPFAKNAESFWKVTLAAFTVFYGLRLTWISLHGTFLQILKQIAILLIALSLGRWTGWLCRIQKLSNHLGQAARERINAVSTGVKPPPGEGFKVCALLLCAAPLGIVGAVTDGLSHYFYPLAVKAIMDGLAVFGLGRLFGWSVILTAVPVLALQGTITLLSEAWVAPFLARLGLIDATNATAGMLIFSVALVMLQLKRIALADYLPSLLFAPLITYIWK